MIGHLIVSSGLMCVLEHMAAGYYSNVQAKEEVKIPPILCRMFVYLKRLLH